MISSLEGFPGTGKSTVISKLGKEGFNIKKEHYEFLKKMPPIPKTKKQKIENHKLFKKIEKKRSKENQKNNVILDRSFISSIVFNRLLGKSDIEKIRKDYKKLIKRGKILFPEKVLILNRSRKETFDFLEKRGYMDNIWMNKNNFERYYELLEDELKYWGICYKIINNNNNVEKLENQIKKNLPSELTIFILSYNALPYLKKTLNSIEKYADVPCKLLIIDNNSKNKTKEYIKEYQTRNPKILSLRKIFNKKNKGFARGCNQGLRKIDTKYYLLMNSDVELLDEGMDNLIQVLEKGACIVGPKTNQFSKDSPDFPQLKNNKKGIRKTDLILGHCIFGDTFKTKNVGYFDENYKIGNFEDFDLSLKLLSKKEKPVVFHDYEVFHHGHKSFKDNNLNIDNYFETNKKRFINKWGKKAIKILKKYKI